MKIAIVGAGVSGLVCAWLLAEEHEVTVYEAADYIGGHTHTVDVAAGGRSYAVDTGFIVYNERTYPNFVRLLARLGVPSKPTRMSFSMSSERSGIEWAGTSLDALFAQRRNLFRPAFLRMIRDILRFNHEAARAAARPAPAGGAEIRLGDWLAERRFSAAFIDQYLVPLGASVWSADPAAFLDMPARFFIGFFHNHGFLSVRDQPAWRVVEGGSRRYVEALTRSFRDRIRLGTPVLAASRHRDHVEIKTGAGGVERHDQLVLATHSDQSLRILEDPSPREAEALAGLPYQENEAVLHTDTRLLPRTRKCWAAWNYHLPRDPKGAVAVSYYMNALQGLEAPLDFCVTLNRGEEIDPARVIRRIRYAHPVFGAAAPAAQRAVAELLNGHNRTWFAGAWNGFGFHEDGVASALAITRRFGRDLDRAGR